MPGDSMDARRAAAQQAAQDIQEATQESDDSREHGEKDETRKAYEYRQRKLSDVFSALAGHNTIDLISDGKSTEEGFSGDGASLFTLLRTSSEGGEEVEPFKLAWGEFSAETFRRALPDPNRANHSGQPLESFRRHEQNRRYQLETLQSFPAPLFVLTQSDGYFGLQIGQKQKDAFEADPHAYMVEHARVASYNGETVVQASRRRRTDEDGSATDQRAQIQAMEIPTYDAVLSSCRNRLVERKMDMEPFARVLTDLPDDREALLRLIRICEAERGRRIRMADGSDFYEDRLGYNDVDVSDEAVAERKQVWDAMQVLPDLGLTNKYAMSWGGEHAVDAILEIKAAFDFESGTFVRE